MIKQITELNGKDYLTVEEASQELGVKENAIRNYLYAEKMTTYKFKSLTLVSRKEVDDWKKRQK